MFSSRLKWSQTQNPLSALLEEKRRTGERVLDLTESNPTRAGLAYPESEIREALAGPAALRYDPQPRGLLTAREAISQYYAERGVEIAASRILLTASTSEAYAYLFKLLADPGDEVLVPRPSYPLFEFLAALESVGFGSTRCVMTARGTSISTRWTGRHGTDPSRDCRESQQSHRLISETR